MMAMWIVMLMSALGTGDAEPQHRRVPPSVGHGPATRGLPLSWHDVTDRAEMNLAVSDSACVRIAKAEMGPAADTAVRTAATRAKRAARTPRTVCVGMHRDEVQVAWGLPQGMQVMRQGSTRYAEWRYATHTVFLKDSLVSAVR